MHGGRLSRTAGHLKLLVAVMGLVLSLWPVGAGATAVGAGGTPECVVLAQGEPDWLMLAPQASYFLDRSGQAGLDQIRQEAGFQAHGARPPSYGIADGALWAKVELCNSGITNLTRLLVFRYPRLSAISLFLVHSDGRTSFAEMGDASGRHKLPAAIGYEFPIEIRGGERVQAYVRVAMISGTLVMPLFLATSAAWAAENINTRVIEATLLATIVSIAVFLALMGIIQRNPLSASTAALLIALFLYLATNRGWHDMLLSTEPPFWRHAVPVVTSYLAVVSAAAFLRIYFQMPTDARWLDLVTRILIFAALFSLPLAGFDTRLSQQVISVIGGVLVLMFIAAPVATARQNPRRAMLHLVAWGLPILGFAALLLRDAGLVPDVFLTNFTHLAGSAVGAILFGAIIADKLLQQHIAMERVLEDDSRQLSAAVAQRTDELQRSNRELERNVSELIAAKVSLERSIRSRGIFLANISHELRTPLNAILGFSEIMSRGILGKVQPPAYGQYVASIFNSGQHLLSIIDQMIDLSRMEAGQFMIAPEPTDIGQLIRSCVTMIRGLPAAAGRTIHFEERGGTVQAQVDARAMRQVVINLLNNAVKYSPPDTDIGIALIHRPGTDIAITISNQGAGIAEEFIPYLFEPFNRGDPRISRGIEGIGLGLPLSKRLVEMHGGELALTSAPGVGVVVRIVLPPPAMSGDPAGPSEPVQDLALPRAAIAL